MYDVCVFGRHPQVEPGFNGVMSIDEAIGFSNAGCKVHLYLPHTEQHDVAARLLKANKKNLDDLDRYGIDLEISVLKPGETTGKRYDVGIWQCYRPSDEPYFAEFRRSSGLVTKNFPRLFVSDEIEDMRVLRNQCKKFDLPAFSLMEDQRIAQRLNPAATTCYVPRGFNPEWAYPEKDLTTPVIGFDKAVKAEDGGRRASAHILEVGKRIRARFPESRFFSLRGKEPDLDSINIGVLEFRAFYKAFLNPLWIYMPIDFDHSVHVQGRYTRADGSWGYKGLYENQVVEAQLAGAVPIFRKNDIPQELYRNGKTGIHVDSYDDPDALEAAVTSVIENFPEMSRAARAFALEHHSVTRMTHCWIEGIREVLGR